GLMGVRGIRPGGEGDGGQWLVGSDVDWWDLVRYGPPGFAVYVRIAFRHASGAKTGNPSGEAPADAVRAALTTLGAYTTTPSQGYAAIWEGWTSRAMPPLAPRVKIPNRVMLLFTGPVEALRDAPAVAWYGSAAGPHQEPHLVWPEDQAWCLPARSMRRSSSPWAVPMRRPRPWQKPSRALFDECVTGNRLRCTATRPSPASAHRQAGCPATGFVTINSGVRDT